MKIGRVNSVITGAAAAGIICHLALRLGWGGSAAASPALSELPLILVLILGGAPLLYGLGAKLLAGQFGSDLLAGISILTSIFLGEYLAGSLVVLMLSGGEALESYAISHASSVLDALAKRMPSSAHKRIDGRVQDADLASIAIGDELVVFPHEICPVDGTVIEGHGSMDESFLTGEPYVMSKAPGSSVLSGAINGNVVLAIRAEKLASDSRYAKIMHVMRDSEQRRPRMRRLADQLGAFYSPLALAIAGAAWIATGDPRRFLAVMVIATPCPLLIAIPVAIISTIALSARRGIIIRDPAILEKIGSCRTAIFDKTGTLTYGQPKLTEVLTAEGQDENEILRLVASLERYSKHPLAAAIAAAAETRSLPLAEASFVSENPGEGLRGVVDGRSLRITNRKKLLASSPESEMSLPPQAAGMECIVAIGDRYAAALRFRDAPRPEGASFVHHLQPRHHFDRLLLVSGDRDSEVRYLAEQVGISEIYASQTPEQKLEITRAENAKAKTIFVGDGINDAPALTAATAGIALGQNSDITSEAAGAVIMDSSLRKIDELLHISSRMRSIALQSAVGGMALSVIGMLAAAFGFLPPVAGAIAQELIDLAAVFNALRAALPPRELTDF